MGVIRSLMPDVDRAKPLRYEVLNRLPDEFVRAVAE
jgi:hypothetical protein